MLIYLKNESKDRLRMFMKNGSESGMGLNLELYVFGKRGKHGSRMGDRFEIT